MPVVRPGDRQSPLSRFVRRVAIAASLSAAFSVLTLALTGCSERSVEVRIIGGFDPESARDIHGAPVTLPNGEPGELKVYGFDGAFEMAQAEGWNGRLTVFVLNPPAYSQYFRFSNTTRVTIDHQRFRSSVIDPAGMDAIDNRIARARGQAIISLAQPAIFGSDGTPDLLHSQDGVTMMNEALDALMAQFGALELVLTGQSGSGIMVANLLAMRDDIACAVITSAPFDLQAQEVFNPAHHHYMGAQNPVSPVDSIEDIPHNPRRWIMIGYSETDQIVSPVYQIEYGERLIQLGHNVILEAAEPADNSGHDPVVWGDTQAHACAASAENLQSNANTP